VSAAAADNGAVAKVEFFANGGLIGQDTTSPHSISWSPTQTGSVALTARATDNLGAQTLSSPVTVNVVPPNAAPTATMTSPANGSSYVIGATIAIVATAQDSDGSIAKVEFFANGGKIGEDATASYTFNWTPAVGGSYALPRLPTSSPDVRSWTRTLPRRKREFENVARARQEPIPCRAVGLGGCPSHAVLYGVVRRSMSRSPTARCLV